MSDSGNADTQTPASGRPQPEQLDTRGLLCPMPVIRTQDAIRKLPPGTRLQVVATDPGTMADIPAWVRVHGHELLQASQSAGEFLFEIQVAEST